MNSMELSKKDLLDFIDSTENTMESDNFVFRKEFYAPYTCIIGETKERDGATMIKLTRFLLVAYTDEILIWNPFEIRFDVKDIRPKVVDLIDLSNSEWDKYYKKNLKLLSTKFLMDQFDRLPQSIYASQCIDECFLSGVSFIQAKKFEDIDIDKIIDFLIYQSNSIYSPVFPFSYILTKDKNAKQLAQEAEWLISWVNDPKHIQQSGLLSPHVVNSRVFQTAVSACTIQKSMDTLMSFKAANKDVFSQEVLELRNKIRSVLPEDIKKFHVIYEDECGNLHNEILNNTLNSFYCTDVYEPFFLGLYQKDVRLDHFYVSCIRMDQGIIIPFDRIRKIEYRKKSLLELF